MKQTIDTRLFDVIVRPLRTEKNVSMSQNGVLVFEVKRDATKTQIKKAVEMLFEVKVKSVNTLIHKGKTKVTKGRVGKRSDMKKAMVTLADGKTVDIYGV